MALWEPLRFRSPGVSTWRGAAPLAGATDDTQPRGTLHPHTCDSTSGASGRPHPLPLEQPRGCRRVRHSITILGSIWDSSQRSWSYINKASIIIIESNIYVILYLCTVAQTGVRIGKELRIKILRPLIGYLQRLRRIRNLLHYTLQSDLHAYCFHWARKDSFFLK